MAFFTGEYGRSTSNEAQQIARALLASANLGREDRSPDPKPLRVALDASALDPLRGVKSVVAKKAAAAVNEKAPEVVIGRALERQFDARKDTPIVPRVTLSKEQIQSGGAALKRRIAEEIESQTFLRQFGATLERLAIIRVCTRCRQNFTYADASCTWSCRGHFGRPSPANTWDCCNNLFIPSTDDVGLAGNGGWGYSCTPMSHTDLPLHAPGVWGGKAYWKIPLELKRFVLRCEPWKYFIATEEDFGPTEVIWDVRDMDDVDKHAHIRRLAGLDAAFEDADDEDFEDRVVVETRVKNGKWAPPEEEQAELVSKYSLEKSVIRRGPLSSANSTPTKSPSKAAQHLSKSLFIFVPASPLLDGPEQFVGTSRFAEAIAGPKQRGQAT